MVSGVVSAHAPGFGATLRRQREAAGVSQAALARRAGCDPATVRRCEYGDRFPSLPLAVRLAAALAADEAARCRLVLAAGFVPPGYVVTAMRRETGTTREQETR